MNLWSVIYRISWALLLVIIAATIVRLFHPKWTEYRDAQAVKLRIEEEVRLNEELINVYRIKQERFKNDPEFVERMAHEVGLAKESETIFRFED